MPREFRVAIVGDGVGALITLAVLRHAGLPREDIVIYGDSPSPLATLERYARSVRQQTMRSEGDGHLAPRNFPDLALIDAWRRRTLRPLLAALFNLYHPSLDLILEHAVRVAQRYDFEGAHVASRVGCVRRSETSTDGFHVHDTDGRLAGRARHVVLALGHAPLLWPPEVEPLRGHPRIAHAYDGPEVKSGERVVVVGGGISAVHLWLAALDAGADVIALHRHPLRQQPLNAPRCDFSAAGIDAYRRLSPDRRLARLQADVGSNYPRRWRWEVQLWQARRAGRFATHLAAMTQVDAGRTAADPLTLWLDDRTAIQSDRLILATGFRADAAAHELLRQLIDDYRLPTAAGLLQPADDFTLPPLSRPDSVCAVIGWQARWALPVADTFAGMKYAARRLTPFLIRQ